MSAGAERRSGPHAAPIMLQIVALVAAAVVLATLTLFAVTFQGPPPRSAPVPLGQVADVLVGRSTQLPPRAAIARVAAIAMPTEGLMRDADGSAMLSTLTGREAVLFVTKPLHGRGGGATDAGTAELLGAAIAAVREGAGWRVLRIPPDPMFTRWHLATLGAMLGTLLVLLALAWPIARRITGPLARLAETAEAIHARTSDPPIAIEGPPEVRRVAQALGRMRTRLNATLTGRTDMLIGIAHDMGTPLTRIAFHVDGLPETARTAAIAEIEAMRAMIGSVLDYAREAVPESVPVDIAMLLRQLAEGSSTATLAAPERAMVTGDLTALRRMFGNLVENALRYAGDCAITLTREAEQFVIAFGDTGPGLPDDSEMLFAPFVRGEKSRSRSTGGVGLGLAIARRIAEAHGGSIMCANKPDGGAVFTVRLPAA